MVFFLQRGVHYCPATLPCKSLFKRLVNVGTVLEPPFPPDSAPAPSLLDPALRDLLESIREPAVLYLPGGRIAAVNLAAERLSPTPAVGRTIDELLDRLPACSADGSPVHRGDLPYARALRGEIVSLGERIQITLPDGSTYPTVVTSTPIVRDGKVVAALSIWHDFDAYARELAGAGPAADGIDPWR